MKGFGAYLEVHRDEESVPIDPISHITPVIPVINLPT